MTLTAQRRPGLRTGAALTSVDETSANVTHSRGIPLTRAVSVAGGTDSPQSGDGDSAYRCSVKGCVWRGPHCGIHAGDDWRGYQLEQMVRARPAGGIR